jgi:serine/threonine protein phosphatase 1
MPGQRVYAVGDVHGCGDRLAALHALIAADLADRPIAAPLLVQLGDLVDRGPDSADVVARLAGGPPIAGLPTVVLMGNHERMMLDALAGNDAGAIELWLFNGGAATLRSWGVSPAAPPAAWRAAIPAAQLDFLRALPLTLRLGRYFFVHAGVRPGVALARQAAGDLLWIREPFLSHDGDFGAVVVHGHTPSAAPEVRGNRLGLDTGAVLGGVLTCGVLEGDGVGFLYA